MQGLPRPNPHPRSFGGHCCSNRSSSSAGRSSMSRTASSICKMLISLEWPLASSRACRASGNSFSPLPRGYRTGRSQWISLDIGSQPVDKACLRVLWRQPSVQTAHLWVHPHRYRLPPVEHNRANNAGTRRLQDLLIAAIERLPPHACPYAVIAASAILIFKSNDHHIAAHCL